jgi:hypothetical protein
MLAYKYMLQKIVPTPSQHVKAMRDIAVFVGSP